MHVSLSSAHLLHPNGGGEPTTDGLRETLCGVAGAAGGKAATGRGPSAAEESGGTSATVGLTGTAAAGSGEERTGAEIEALEEGGRRGAVDTGSTVRVRRAGSRAAVVAGSGVRGGLGAGSIESGG